MEEMFEDEKYQKIVKDYKETNNIRGTAKKNQVSIVKVRRVLITEGLWSSPSSEAVKKLWEDGLTAKEIADALQMSLKSVQAYMPYSRGAYGESETSDSMRSKNYRERCKDTFQTQVLYGYAKDTNDDLMMEIKRANNKMYNSFSFVPERALRLRLELIGSEVEKRPEIGLYGKAESNISRTVLVPATMNFHALHFLIQKAFGWRNKQPHHFGLTRNEFMWITNDYFRTYEQLCGVYFRFPIEKGWDKMADKYWNDDYTGKESFSTWLKGKYCGPYSYLGYYDHYCENALAVRRFRKKHRYKDVYMPVMYDDNKPIMRNVKICTDTSTVNMVNKVMNFDQELNYLCERLQVCCVITVKDRIDGDPRDIAGKAAVSNMVCHYQTRKKAKAILSHVAYMREQMKDSRNMNLGREKAWDAYQDYILRSTPETKPVSDMVIYHYGNDWSVRVTCEEVYYEQENGDGFCDRNGNSVEKEMKQYLTDYIMKEVPVCLLKDGLSVMDDMEGVKEYCSFLRVYFDMEKSAERDACRNRGRKYGWSPKDVDLRRIL
ncbi:MAG: plasmid pRiA4b ORF-3 family protein [Lachnospiraceae bacterium]|nr:plasmid pRiA4b ORF-3 family protein [Lachnospiraceae bacterium]